MTTLPYALAEACQLLRQDMHRTLDEAEYLAMKTEPWDHDDAQTASEVIPDLIDAVRAVLREHDANLQGRCRICHGTWPCRTAQVIHEILKDPERSLSALDEFG